MEIYLKRVSVLNDVLSRITHLKSVTMHGQLVTFTRMENVTAFWPSVYLSSSFIHSTVDWLAKGEKNQQEGSF